MSARAYYLDLFTGTTWAEFLNAGGTVSGFRESRWSRVQKIVPGDYLLCYLTGVSRWVGVLEVVGGAYKAPPNDGSDIWKDEAFPCRLPVKVVAALTPETAVPILDMRDRLTIFQNLKNPNMWSGALRGSPQLWKAHDGEAVTSAVLEALARPVTRELDAAKLARRPRSLASIKVGDVTLPEEDEVAEERESRVEPGPSVGTAAKEATVHTEMQWTLLKLGSSMGLSVWAPRSDRGREWGGQAINSIPNLLSELPHQFDDATNRVIENIDVLWLTGNAFTAAFEIESTTSIYSGLLRMSDLIAMQPNLNIPLFIVAPDERRNKVIAEVNRATFANMRPPLVDICRFIPFGALREHAEKAAPFVQFLKPDAIQAIAESCETD